MTRSGNRAVPAAPRRRRQPDAAPAPQPKLDLATGERPAKALRPWIEVALPHPDVLANRFKEAEFAADLFAVDAGHATEDYATPENFFRITFLTEGLKRVLTSALQRLAGTGGDPVIGLQTAFGGGKTHTMLAVYHLAKATRPGAARGRRSRSPTRPASRPGRRPRSRCSSARPRAPTSRSILQGRPEGPHALGLHRLAARRRGRA